MVWTTPPPEALARYEEAIPGSGRGIIDASNEERRHRHEIKNKITNESFAIKRRSQNVGIAILSLCVIILAYKVFSSNEQWIISSLAFLVISVMGILYKIKG